MAISPSGLLGLRALVAMRMTSILSQKWERRTTAL